MKSSTELGRTTPEFVSLMWRMFLAEECMVTENIRPVGVVDIRCGSSLHNHLGCLELNYIL